MAEIPIDTLKRLCTYLNHRIMKVLTTELGGAYAEVARHDRHDGRIQFWKITEKKRTAEIIEKSYLSLR